MQAYYRYHHYPYSRWSTQEKSVIPAGHRVELGRLEARRLPRAHSTLSTPTQTIAPSTPCPGRNATLHTPAPGWACTGSGLHMGTVPASLWHLLVFVSLSLSLDSDSCSQVSS